jgi:hypothetical protein
MNMKSEQRKKERIFYRESDLLCHLILHPLEAGFPLVPSPWGEGQGEGVRAELFEIQPVYRTDRCLVKEK